MKRNRCFGTSQFSISFRFSIAPVPEPPYPQYNRIEFGGIGTEPVLTNSFAVIDW